MSFPEQPKPFKVDGIYYYPPFEIFRRRPMIQIIEDDEADSSLAAARMHAPYDEAERPL